MAYKVLTDEQVEQFIDRGHIHLRDAFPREAALRVQEFIWDRLAERGIKQDDPSTWTEPRAHIRENFSGPIFDACATERLADAIEDLVGEGRWMRRGQPDSWGWWPVNFSVGAERPWDVPTMGWHWDGGHFRHYLTSPEQGVLTLCVFSDVAPRSGGTLIAEGSHHLVARFLSRHNVGLPLTEAVAQCSRSHPWLADLTGTEFTPSTDEPSAGSPGPASSGADRVERFMNDTFVDAEGTRLRVVETTPSAGDVILGHPFLYHSGSQNPSGVPRFICNRTAPLREPMCFERMNGDHSPVERSIRIALGLALRSAPPVLTRAGWPGRP